MVKYIPYKQLFIYYKSRKNEGVHMEINIGIIAIIVLAIAILAILASGYVKASPNKAYIISGIKREPKVAERCIILHGFSSILGKHFK